MQSVLDRSHLQRLVIAAARNDLLHDLRLRDLKLPQLFNFLRELGPELARGHAHPRTAAKPGRTVFILIFRCRIIVLQKILRRRVKHIILAVQKLLVLHRAQTDLVP